MRHCTLIACLIAVAAAALLMGGCQVVVDKRVGVWFEEGAQPRFPALPGGIADGETAVASADLPAAADASSEQPGGIARANWQFGLFTFNTVHESATDTYAEQALRAGLTANVPMQGGTVNADTTEGDIATGGGEPE